MVAVDRERVKALFLEASDLQGEARQAFIESACEDDANLRSEVMSLLAADGTAGVSVVMDAVHRSRERELARDAEDAARDLPEHIGTYRVESLLGVGGMGRVYLAEQESPRRMVALKVVREGVFSTGMLRRFELETEMLGRLRHPGVAQIYDAGMVDGTPYFAMEYVDGETLTDFAADRGLSARERLELMARVCDAVHHAHQKGVIHRDLKPGNILVDESGQPKILDFGVARATASDIEVTSVQTMAGQLVGTLPYMSPEQAGGETDEIDVRSDVYALGLVLYELLAGRPARDMEGKALHEAVRCIRETVPVRLGSVERRLRGDVETIVHKALEGDKERRYQSAAALGADIRRYLANEPIAARPPSAMYQMRRFARRNKVLVGAATMVFMVLVLAVIGMSWTLYKAKLDLERRAIMQYYVGLMQVAVFDSVNEGNDPAFFIDLLDRAADGMEQAIAARPHTEAEIRLNIADLYRSSQAWEQTLEHSKRSYDILLEEKGPESWWTLWAEVSMADALRGLERRDEALTHYQHCLEVYRERLDWLDPDTPTALEGTVELLRELGRGDEAQRELTITLDLLRASPGEDEEKIGEWIEEAEALLQATG